MPHSFTRILVFFYEGKDAVANGVEKDLVGPMTAKNCVCACVRQKVVRRLMSDSLDWWSPEEGNNPNNNNVNEMRRQVWWCLLIYS